MRCLACGQWPEDCSCAERRFEELREQLEHVAACRALGELGLAVQLGMLAALATTRIAGWDGPEPGVRVSCGDVERSLLAGLGGRP
jgi:hypothetical protein